MSAGFDGSIRIDTSINSGGFNKGVKGLMSSLKSLAIAVGIAFSIGAVIAFGKASVDAASDIQSAFIGLQSIVEGQGKSFSGAKDFINEYISDGLVPAGNAVTAYKNLLMRGYSTEQIETVMGALKNSSAFGRQASLTMGQAVQSATEGLKNENSILVDNAGVTKNVSMMWKDYALSIGTTVGALTKEQKIEAEVQGILQETRFQMGDASKLSQTYAGKISALGVSFTNLKVAIGNSIIPIINQVVPYIKAAVYALTVLFNQIAQIMNALFGTSVSMSSVTGELDSVVDSSQDAADAQDNLATGIEETQKAAKGALAAFDDLNVLQAQDVNTGSSDNGNPTDTMLTLPPVEDAPLMQSLTSLEEKVLAFKAKFLEFISPVVDALIRLKEALGPLGETIWSGLKWAWDNILVPLGEWAITDLLPAFLDLLGADAETLNSILVALQPSWQWFWDNFLKPLAEWVGGEIIDFLNWLADALERFSGWMDEHGETAVLVIEIIAAIVGVLWLLNAAVGAINVAIGIYNSVMAIAALVTGAVTLPLLLIIALILAVGVLIYLLITQWDQLSTTVQQIAFIIEFYFNQLKDRLSNTIQQIAFIIEFYFNQLKDRLSNTISQLGFIISYYFKQAAASFKEAFFSALDDVSEKFKNIFLGVKSFVKGVINGIIDTINGMIAGISDGINAIITGANAVGAILPGYSPLPTIAPYQIPHLAKGAVIPPNAEFAAILGDQRSGRNIEAPEALIRQIIRDELSGSGGGEITVNMPVYLDSEKIYDGQKKVQTRRGASLITSGATS